MLLQVGNVEASLDLPSGAHYADNAIVTVFLGDGAAMVEVNARRIGVRFR